MWDNFVPFWSSFSPYKHNTNLKNSTEPKDNDTGDFKTAEYYSQIAQEARIKSMQDFKNEIFRSIRNVSYSGKNCLNLVCPMNLDTKGIETIKTELGEKGFNVSIKDGFYSEQILKVEW